LTTACLTAGTRARAGAEDEPKSVAQDLALDAEAARAGGLYERCIEKDQASLGLEEKLATRVHLVDCADHAGKVLLALRTLQPVLDSAVQTGNDELAELSRLRTEKLLRRLGALTIMPPPVAVPDLAVAFDDKVVPPPALGKPITVDPGKHRVHAEGTLEGTRASFDEVVTICDGERSTVAITLRPSAPEFLTPGQLECLTTAKSQEEVLHCLPEKNKPLVARVAIEGSTYEDTFAVTILSPAIHGSLMSPTKGWNVNASYLADFVTAASPDFVSTASPHGADTRQAASIGGGYKPGAYGASIGGAYSTEADYVSRSGYVALLGDFWEKRITPRVSYAFTYDTISRGGTPVDVFHNTLTSHEATASSSFITSPTTIVVAGVSASFERGDQSKPYRLIPMFAPGVEVPKGASVDLVNATRLPIRPYEQLPLARDRFAASGILNHRFNKWTLRLDERLYDDSWEIRASSTDVRALFDIGSRIIAGPHVRFHAQTGAVFHQLVYHATETPMAVPIYRTTDRELTPLVSTTGGLSAWWHVVEAGPGIGWTVYASGDALYSRYFDSLYVTERWAGYGTIGVEAEIE
jgi:hypothetical protein